MFPLASEHTIPSLDEENSSDRPPQSFRHSMVSSTTSTINNTGQRDNELDLSCLSPRNLVALRISLHEVVASHALKTQPVTEVSEPLKMM